MYLKEIDTWDYQLCFLLQKNNGKCIVPNVNLISNIGFGIDATHTFNQDSKDANRIKFEIKLPLTHKPCSISELKINDYYDKNEFLIRPILIRAVNKILKYLIK